MYKNIVDTESPPFCNSHFFFYGFINASDSQI